MQCYILIYSTLTREILWHLWNLGRTDLTFLRTRYPTARQPGRKNSDKFSGQSKETTGTSSRSIIFFFNRDEDGENVFLTFHRQLFYPDNRVRVSLNLGQSLKNALHFKQKPVFAIRWNSNLHIFGMPVHFTRRNGAESSTKHAGAFNSYPNNCTFVDT